MSRLFKILDGPLSGEIVGADDVTDCDACDGVGLAMYRPPEGRAHLAECPQCAGSGYVLGYPGVNGGLPPERVAVVEVTPEASPGKAVEQAGAVLIGSPHRTPDRLAGRTNPSAA